MKRYSLFLVIVLFCSCNYFKPEQKPESIARVGKSYLYKSDIATLVPVGTSKEDSVLMVRDFINRWASQKLLIEAAERNLSDKKKGEYNALIKQYKIDLYTKAYIEEVVKNTVDTLVSQQELKKYYDENKENFKTNETLVRLRFVNLAKDNPRFATIRSKFFDYNKKDKKFWDTYALQFKSFALNDSVWVDMSQVYGKLPVINPDNRDEMIRPGRKAEIQSNEDVYLIKITNVIDKNQISPFEYIKPTLKEVILNKRKLELIKKFEKEITDDAIKNKDYEIYK
ncbi:peptidyl-prolyl cis-trans isomerase [Flavobacterium sp. J49]|uniref:peptidylprolyl isomerase n=1 Tax=Flavobacterium sp. J49 TaxID=2718534 RepID=UPI0015942B51|nr:peptidylprolyl isomerase [Flavobacterium sp. J49]MBF6641035.1 peptidyl-prolyl cis-trans isomerase [Flavobacterium sp. J49]NIC02282.1 peptidyl-prolyl cis-trans isomerase [Flavobacterium sp. J49]